MRNRAIAGALLLALSLTPDTSHGQFGTAGGGGGGFSRGGGLFGGRGGSSGDSSFDRLMQSYGGSGDVLDFSRITPEERTRFDGFSRFTNSPPLPTSGTITREQFRAQVSQALKARSFGGPPGGPTGAPGPFTTAAPAGGGANVVIDLSSPPTPSTTTSPASSGGYPGGGGFGGMGRGNEDPDSMFQKLDQNQDGKLSRDEMSQSRRGLGQSFDTFDTNRDGYVDLAEFRAGMATMSGGRGPGGFGGPPGGGFGGPPGGWGGDGSSSYNQGSGSNGRGDPKNIDPDDDRPVVYRYGKLPREFEKEFGSLDSDKDGQIGLYEWRAAGRDIEKFVKMDLNGDGFITAEEYLRFIKVASATTTTSDGKVTTSGSPGAFGFSRDRGGSSSDRPSFGEKSFGDRSKDKEKERGPGGFGSSPGGGSTNPWKRN